MNSASPEESSGADAVEAGGTVPRGPSAANVGVPEAKVPDSVRVGTGLLFAQILVAGTYLLLAGVVGVVLAGADPSGLPLVLLLGWVVYFAIRNGVALYRGSEQARWESVGYLVIVPGVASFGGASLGGSAGPISLVISAAAIRSLLHPRSAAYCAGTSRPTRAALGSVLLMAGLAIMAAGVAANGVDESGAASSWGMWAALIAGAVLVASAKPAEDGNESVMGAAAFAAVAYAVTMVAAAMASRAPTSTAALGALAAIAVTGFVVLTSRRAQRPDARRTR